MASRNKKAFLVNTLVNGLMSKLKSSNDLDECVSLFLIYAKFVLEIYSVHCPYQGLIALWIYDYAAPEVWGLPEADLHKVPEEINKIRKLAKFLEYDDKNLHNYSQELVEAVNKAFEKLLSEFYKDQYKDFVDQIGEPDFVWD